VLPTRKRQRPKVVKAVVGAFFAVILMRDRTLKKATMVKDLCGIMQMYPFIPHFIQQSRLPDKHKIGLVCEGQQ
jgi:hypothetical protein